jgi:signal transduction histidine kinase
MGVGRPRVAIAMRRRIVVLAGLHLALAVSLNWLAMFRASAGDVVGWRTIVFLVAFAVVGLLPVNVEVGRQSISVTLVEAVLVVGLFLVAEPFAVVLAAAAGEVVACLLHRQRGLKLVFNTAAAAGTVTLAAATFALRPAELDATAPAMWFMTLAAVGAYAIANLASTSAVLAAVEDRPFGELILSSLPPAAVASTVSAALGLAVVVLFAAAPSAPLLLVPLAAVAVLNTRALNVHQAEHLRFRRLYEAAGRTAGLRSFDESLGAVADEARSLVGGAVAVAAAPDRTGAWRGVVVGADGGVTLADARTIASARDAAASEDPHAPASSTLRTLLPSMRQVVAASATGHLQCVLVVLRDLTDDRRDARAEVLSAFAGHAALAAANASLLDEVEETLHRQLNLHRQKDEFLAAFSHELRTPLAAVLASVMTLRRVGSRVDADQRDRLCEISERQARKLERLIADVLLVAQAEAGKVSCRLEPVEVQPFLQRLAAAAPVPPGAAEPLAVAVEVAPGTPRVVVTDPARLQQIVGALIDNAAKFAPGRVELAAGPISAGAAGSEGVVVSVRDHGPGIRPEERERAFERFVQLDQSSTRRHGGTGTGLYLARQLAQLLGCRLRLEETPGGGCTFTVAVPDQSDRAIAPEPVIPHHEHRPVVAAAGAPATRRAQA